MKIKVGLVDDHQLFLKSVSLMLETLGDYEVIVEALNGRDLIRKLQTASELPEIMLIDMEMEVMDGVETANWLQTNHPAIRLVALTMNDKDSAIIKMFKAGCCAYLLKDMHPQVLDKALQEVYKKGYFNLDTEQFSPGKLLLKAQKEAELAISFNELEFLKLACSELTYKEIAERMNKSERTIDGYRDVLFKKLNVQSRVGLCLEAIRKDLVTLK